MPPLIKRPKYIPGWQLGLVVGCGIITGFYVWQPVFSNLNKEVDKKDNK